MDVWHYFSGSEIVGPLSSGAMIRLIETGVVRLDTPVSKGGATWQRADSFPELSRFRSDGARPGVYSESAAEVRLNEARILNVWAWRMAICGLIVPPLLPPVILLSVVLAARASSISDRRYGERLWRFVMTLAIMAGAGLLYLVVASGIVAARLGANWYTAAVAGAVLVFLTMVIAVRALFHWGVRQD